MRRRSDTRPDRGGATTPSTRTGGWRWVAVSLAVVGALAGCSSDDADVDEGEVVETLLPTAPPATDPLDPSE